MRHFSPIRDDGFTLIELLVVLAIIALFMTVAPPMLFRARPSVAIKVATQELAEDLRSSRGMAVTNAQETSVLFDVEAKTYVTRPAQVVHHLPDGTLMEFRGPSGQVLGQQGAIRFLPDGSSTGGVVQLALEGTVHRVAVSWLTGKVSLDE